MKETNKAGGQNGEVVFDGDIDNTNTYFRLVTPQIKIPEYSNCTLEFKHFNDIDYSSNHILKVEIFTDGGTTWEDSSWVIVPDNNIGPETVSISLDNYSGENIKIGFTASGPTYYIGTWYIDDIVVTAK